LRNQNDMFLMALLVMAAAVLILCFTALTASEAVKTVFYDYSAKKMTVDRKTGVTVFEGDAKLKVRDSDDYLNADKVTIYRDVKTGELVKMDAVGNVDMSQKGMKATCERAIFYEKEERIELEGSEGSEDSPAVSAVVDDGKNRIEAPAITYFRGEDRLEARGDVTGHVTIEGKEGETEEEAEEKSEE
jgi:lipopolysaccharide transport protein LptA